MLKFSIIVAMDRNHGIGCDGGLPWNIPEDLKHFKSITTTVVNPSKKNAVLMGRKTWESLPREFRPLPGRINIVLTRDKQLKLPDGVHKLSSFDGLEGLVNGLPDIERIFVIGGEQVFRETISFPGCGEIYMTKINAIFKCDTFFPDFEKKFALQEALGEGVSSETSFSFYRYLRRPE